MTLLKLINIVNFLEFRKHSHFFVLKYMGLNLCGNLRNFINVGRGGIFFHCVVIVTFQV